jgi:hypothetical protein
MSKLPSSLNELRIFGDHIMGANTEVSDPLDRMQLEHFAKPRHKLKYASIILDQFDWNTYGIIP